MPTSGIECEYEKVVFKSLGFTAFPGDDRAGADFDPITSHVISHAVQQACHALACATSVKSASAIG
jgi:hypothetical protein